MTHASLNLRYLNVDFVFCLFFSSWRRIGEGICWKEEGAGQGRMRGEGITGTDPIVQVLIFRDVVRAEELLCASCVYQLFQAVNCIVNLGSEECLPPTQLHFSCCLTPHLCAKQRTKQGNSVPVGTVICARLLLTEEEQLQVEGDALIVDTT